MGGTRLPGLRKAELSICSRDSKEQPCSFMLQDLKEALQSWCQTFLRAEMKTHPQTGSYLPEIFRNQAALFLSLSPSPQSLHHCSQEREERTSEFDMVLLRTESQN